jgi:hypothetical protein
VQIGDLVRVEGVVSEFNGLTEITSFTDVTVLSNGNALPTVSMLALPVASVDDFEAFEGMYVTFPQALRKGDNHYCILECHAIESPCKQCDLRCSFMYEDCPHQCPSPCHPSSVPHPLCAVAIKMGCYCSYSEILFKCFETKDAALIHERKQCGRPCAKKKVSIFGRIFCLSYMEKNCGHLCSRQWYSRVCFCVLVEFVEKSRREM